MPTVADQLHEAREARKLTIEQVAEVTKIRSDHVRALEEGNFNVFSAPVYIRGFVRSYAGALKLDVREILGELRSCDAEPSLLETVRLGFGLAARWRDSGHQPDDEKPYEDGDSFHNDPVDLRAPRDAFADDACTSVARLAPASVETVEPPSGSVASAIRAASRSY